MSNQIQLKIVLPNKVLPAEDVTQVIIPAYHGMLTVIRDRAPTSVLLNNGILDVLNANGSSVKKYFLQGGVANIAANECVVMTNKALDMKSVTEQEIQELLSVHQQELKELNSGQEQISDSDTQFYQDLLKYLKIAKA